MRRFVRYVEIGWNRLEGGLSIFQPIHLPDEFLAILRHLVQQVFGKKTRSLADPEFHRCSAALFHHLQEALIFFWREVRVKPLAKGGNHELRPLLIETSRESKEFCASTFQQELALP